MDASIFIKTEVANNNPSSTEKFSIFLNKPDKWFGIVFMLKPNQTVLQH